MDQILSYFWSYFLKCYFVINLIRGSPDGSRIASLCARFGCAPRRQKLRGEELEAIDKAIEIIEAAMMVARQAQPNESRTSPMQHLQAASGYSGTRTTRTLHRDGNTAPVRVNLHHHNHHFQPETLLFPSESNDHMSHHVPTTDHGPSSS